MNTTDHHGRRDRHSQRVSIHEHERFRHSMAPAAQRFDDIDELCADPMVERHATRRREHEAARVLRILDELKPGGTNG